MVRRRIARARDRVREKLEEAFIEDHTSREVALSFSIGVFVTALPTLGFGLVVFVVLAYLFKQVSKIALFASVLVLNPAVKWGVYGTSFWIGNRLFGPVPGVSVDSLSLLAGPGILLRLWVGNVILATVFALVAYVVAFRLVTAYRLREAEGSLPLDAE